MSYIGIDLGTTGCKAVVYENGTLRGSAYIEYPLIVLSPLEVEQDAQGWWDLSCQAVREAMKQSGLPVEEVKAVSISSQGISCVPVDRQVRPLCNAISWLDMRAVEQAAQIRQRYSDEELFAITAKRPSETYTLPKLLWLMQKRPELMKQAYKVLMPQDFLLAKMCGKFISDHSMAGGTMLYDVTAQDWSAPLMEAFGIDRNWLPDLQFAGTVAGPLLPEAAAQMGLTERTLAVVGGQDQKVAAFYAEPDVRTATVSLGTAGAIECLCDRPVLDPKRRIPCFSYLTPGIWTLESVVSTTGAGLKWLRNTLFENQKYSELDALCEQTPAGSNGVMFYPHLSGASSPHWKGEQKGVFNGLTLDTGRGELVRAVLEGISYQMKSNLLVCDELGSPVDTLAIFGGGASDTWCRILCNITGKKVVAYSASEAAGLGAVRLACQAVGDTFSPEETARRVFVPDPELQAIYEEQYRLYAAFEQRLMA